MPPGPRVWVWAAAGALIRTFSLGEPTSSVSRVSFAVVNDGEGAGGVRGRRLLGRPAVPTPEVSEYDVPAGETANYADPEVTEVFVGVRRSVPVRKSVEVGAPETSCSA